MNSIKAVCVFIPVFLSASVSLGQSSTTRIGSSTFRGADIPNPNNPLAIATLAVNPTVAAELGLDEKRLKALKSLFRESRGSLETVVFEPKNREEARDVKARDVHRQKTLKARQEALEEILTPDDLKRLRQIAFQIEVTRSGFGVAITSGALSENVGVNDDQKMHLKEKAEQIEAKLQAKIAKLLVEAQEEMLKELSAEQREKAKECLGKPFYYREDMHLMNSPSRYED